MKVFPSGSEYISVNEWMLINYVFYGLFFHDFSEVIAAESVACLNKALCHLKDIWEEIGIPEDQRLERTNVVKNHIKVSVECTCATWILLNICFSDKLIKHTLGSSGHDDCRRRESAETSDDQY